MEYEPLLMKLSLKQQALFSVLYVRLREENPGPTARGEEDSGIPRGRPRSCRLVPGARGPPPEGEWRGGGVVGTPASGTGGMHHTWMSYKVWKEKCLEAGGIHSSGSGWQGNSPTVRPGHSQTGFVRDRSTM